MHRFGWYGWLLCVAFAAQLGCAPHGQYRLNYSPCVSAQPETECRDRAIQDVQAAAGDYLLGFVEFDDQGQVFDRHQMHAVIEALAREVSAEREVLMVVFVHGWKHNAGAGDDNVTTFRKVLAQLSLTEQQISARSGVTPRRIAGVYLGWRGASIIAPLLKELTFWDRKNTAHKVGHGGVTEVLNRIEQLRLAKRFQVQQERPGAESNTRLVVVGHSFGGAVVFSALAQLLESRFIHSAGPPDRVSTAEGFGDLVVLINPAFEALRFAPLSDMSTERGMYFPAQLPLLAILTSEADQATRKAFPAGRWFSTVLEKTRQVERRNGVTQETEYIDQRRANRATVGHFGPYRTHWLYAQAQGVTAGDTANLQQQTVDTYDRNRDAWRHDRPGSTIDFPGSRLIRTDSSAGRNPYLVVQVDKALIHNHNHIDDPRIIQFVNQLILISAQHRNGK